LLEDLPSVLAAQRYPLRFHEADHVYDGLVANEVGKAIEIFGELRLNAVNLLPRSRTRFCN
jgi:hypothetical protein